MPEMPEIAGEESQEGLLAFAAYWFDLVSYAYATGDLAPVLAVTGDACPTCKNIFTQIAGLYADGHWMQGGGLSLERAETNFEVFELPIDAPGYRVLLIIGQDPITTYGSDGSELGQSEGFSGRGNVMFCTFSNGVWTVEAVGSPKGSS